MVKIKFSKNARRTWVQRAGGSPACPSHRVLPRARSARPPFPESVSEKRIWLLGKEYKNVYHSYCELNRNLLLLCRDCIRWFWFADCLLWCQCMYFIILTFIPTPSLTYSHTHLLTYSLTFTPTPPLIITHSPTHSLTHPLTHSRTRILQVPRV